MSELPTPNDRVEALLYAIATGDTADLPTPKTREEKLLMCILKNGVQTGGSSGPKTNIEFTNTINWSHPNTNLETFYVIKNGWCFLHVVAHCNKVANDENSIVFVGLPKPPFQVYGKFSGEDNTYEPCNLTVGPSGQMLLRGGTAGKDYSFTYTYPLAD